MHRVTDPASVDAPPAGTAPAPDAGKERSAARHRTPLSEPPVRRPRPARGRRRPSTPAVAVLVVGLVITAALALLVRTLDSRNESRLLKSQVRQTGALLQAVLPTVQTPLASAAAIARASGGKPGDFTGYVSDYVGEGKPFAAAVLMSFEAGGPRVVARAGAATLPDGSAAVTSLVARARSSGKLELAGPFAGRRDRIAYAFAAAGAAPRFVVYAEGLLPPKRRIAPQPGSPFGNLRFALYLGPSTRPDRLLETNVADLPLGGRTASVRVPFGGSSLTIVAGSSTTFGGSLAESLWWAIALAGVLISATAALTAQRLVNRGTAAERLTAEVRTLLSEQRTIAESLQHALLPQRLPDVPGLSITTRYVAGTDGVQIGGDWYDVVPLAGDRFFFVVGDVSGRGTSAGAVMASLLFAIRGFVSEGYPPDRVLDAAAQLIDIEHDKHFATVVCGVADVPRRQATIASAGHLPPLIVSTERTEFVAVPTGPPIGVRTAAGYVSTTIPLPPGATLLAYTDGLVERRGETLDDGLRRLMDAARGAGVGGEALVEALMEALLPDGTDDDTAVLGLQWRS